MLFCFETVQSLNAVFWLGIISQRTVFNYGKFAHYISDDNGPLNYNANFVRLEKEKLKFWVLIMWNSFITDCRVIWQESRKGQNSKREGRLITNYHLQTSRHHKVSSTPPPPTTPSNPTSRTWLPPNSCFSPRGTYVQGIPWDRDKCSLKRGVLQWRYQIQGLYGHFFFNRNQCLFLEWRFPLSRCLKGVVAALCYRTISRCWVSCSQTMFLGFLNWWKHE